MCQHLEGKSLASGQKLVNLVIYQFQVGQRLRVREGEGKSWDSCLVTLQQHMTNEGLWCFQD